MESPKFATHLVSINFHYWSISMFSAIFMKSTSKLDEIFNFYRKWNQTEKLSWNTMEQRNFHGKNESGFSYLAPLNWKCIRYSSLKWIPFMFGERNKYCSIFFYPNHIWSMGHASNKDLDNRVWLIHDLSKRWVNPIVKIADPIESSSNSSYWAWLAYF